MALPGALGAPGNKFRYMREHPETIWSTQELFLLGKIQMVGQSAGNQMLSNDNVLGSSETTRETLSNNDIDNSLNLNEGPPGGP